MSSYSRKSKKIGLAARVGKWFKWFETKDHKIKLLESL